MKFTYGKQEKLKSKKLIERLFAEGDSVAEYPIRLKYLSCEHDSKFLIQAGVSVSKRKVNKAVDRNRIKRMLRETYRYNKYEFSDVLDCPYIFMFIFLGSKEPNFDELNQKMNKLAKKFTTKVATDKSNNKND